MKANLEYLTQVWVAAKANLKAAQETLLAAEIDIYNAVKDTLPARGTTTLETGLKVVTGMTEKWDQGKLQDIYNAWDAPVPFPFRGELKPDGKALAYVKENLPTVWKQIQEALTTQEKKPAFSLANDKE